MFLDDSFNFFLFHSLLSKTVDADIDGDVDDAAVDAAAVVDDKDEMRLRLRRDEN